MVRLHDSETEDTESYYRPRNKFRFDRSINVGNLVVVIATFISLIFAYTSYHEDLVRFRKTSDRMDVMWEHFIREHVDISLDDLRRGR